MQQLVSAKRLLGEVQQMSARRCLNSNAQMLEKITVRVDKVIILNELRKIARLSANGDQPATMEPVTTRTSRR